MICLLFLLLCFCLNIPKTHSYNWKVNLIVVFFVVFFRVRLSILCKSQTKSNDGFHIFKRWFSYFMHGTQTIKKQNLQWNWMVCTFRLHVFSLNNWKSRAQMNQCPNRMCPNDSSKYIYTTNSWLYCRNGSMRRHSSEKMLQCTILNTDSLKKLFKKK